MTPPRPPDRVIAFSGQEQLDVEFAYDLPSADTTSNSFEIYCDPAPGVSHEGAPAAADPGSCPPSSVLVAGTDGSLVSAQHCGSASKSASSALVGGLSAGVSYNVALTAVDSYENESVLSPVVCQVPVVRDPNEPNQHDEQKSSACAFSRRGQTLPLLAVLILAGLLAARRQRCRITATVANS